MLYMGTPDTPRRPSKRQIHIWPVWLRASDQDVDHAEALLATHERQRAETLRFARLRRDFLLTHGCLRTLLGGYLGIAATDLRMGVAHGGKPFLKGSTADLRFNHSKSGDLAVFAFSLGRELGVDIEAIRAVLDMERVAMRCFACEETNDFLELPRAQRTRAFLAAWTRKEAYVKAIGEGLRVPLDEICVTLRPEDPPRIVHIGGYRSTARRWRIHSFELSERFLGALAYRGSELDVQVFPTRAASEILNGETERRGAGPPKLI